MEDNISPRYRIRSVVPPTGSQMHHAPERAGSAVRLPGWSCCSFVDGKPYRTLKRHLSVHGLTIEGYRARYGLPNDYPSVRSVVPPTGSQMHHAPERAGSAVRLPGWSCC
jgi:hypothetical protein